MDEIYNPEENLELEKRKKVLDMFPALGSYNINPVILSDGFAITPGFLKLKSKEIHSYDMKNDCYIVTIEFEVKGRIE